MVRTNDSWIRNALHKTRTVRVQHGQLHQGFKRGYSVTYLPVIWHILVCGMTIGKSQMFAEVGQSSDNTLDYYFVSTDSYVNDTLFNSSDQHFSYPSNATSLAISNDTSDGVTTLSLSTPQAIVMAAVLGVIMIGTVAGNILVILSVFTYKPLRNVQNIFLVSLAAADIAVAVFVMPFNVAYSLTGKWMFGLHLCELWLTCDVLCCTASILNLCAIALDRYWAIHDPINYAQKRTLNRVLWMIFMVWLISTLISVPPLIGWNDWPETFTSLTPCQLTGERGYIVYSSSGSFFIPLIIMTVVYLKIFQTAKHRIRVKAKAVTDILKKNGNSPKPSSLSWKGIATRVFHRETQTDTSRLNCNISSIELEEKSSCLTTPKLSSETKENELQQSENHKTIVVVTVKTYMEQKERICLQKERRAAQVLGIVMGVFVLCWLPFFLMYVIIPFCKDCPISNDIVNFITWLGYMNSALNPVIYTVFNTDFRKSFHRLLCGK